jgi:hypothetical protein
MARSGSTTSRTASASSRTRSKAAQAADKAADSMVDEATEVTAQTDFDSTMVEAESTDDINENTDEVEETSMTTETVEAPAEEAVASDTTETVETAEGTSEADEAAKKAKAEADAAEKLDAFKSVTESALSQRDTTTGTLPEVHNQTILGAYRALPGAKGKSAAKKHLTDLLKSAINSADIVLGMAIMQVTNLVTAAPASTPKAPTETKKVDPTEAFVESLATLHLAYTLRREDIPNGVDAETAFTQVDEKVNELSEQASTYYTWFTNKAADKGAEPEVPVLVKRAVKAALGRAVGSGAPRKASTGQPKAPMTGPRRSIRTHIAQVFGDSPVGTVLKVAEIAKATTEEYPDGDCSPGAVSAALKSTKGVDGFESTTDENGSLAARKIA